MDTFAVKVAALTAIRRVRYHILVVYALFVWDAMLLISEEWELVYKARLNYVKINYLICRFYPLLVWPIIMYFWVLDHNIETCENVLVLVNGLLIPLQFFPQAVLLARAWAFSGQNKYILVLCFMCLGFLLSAEVWGYLVGVKLGYSAFRLFGKTGCFREHSPDEKRTSQRVAHAILSALLVDTIATFIVIGHCIRTRSTQGQIGRLIIQQGLAWFVLMVSLYAVTAALYLGPNRFLDGVSLPFVLVLPNMLACRVILQIRRQFMPTETQQSNILSLVVQDAMDILNEPQGEANQDPRQRVTERNPRRILRS